MMKITLFFVVTRTEAVNPTHKMFIAQRMDMASLNINAQNVEVDVAPDTPLL